MSTVNLNNLYAWGEQLVNKLGQDIIPTNIVIKFDNDPINMISNGQT